MPQAATLSGLPRLPHLRQLSRLALVTELSPADWLVESLTDFAKSIYSFVPEGFASYVRVFHPAELEGRPVSWAEIAAANGKLAHGGMEISSLTGLDDRASEQSGVFDFPPDEGNLPEALLTPLVSILERHSETPERCWFAYWNGWGGFEPAYGYPPKFATPGREYLLFSGSLEGVADSPYDFRPQSPSIWWPSDHAWCVATEIDHKTTYIGCSRTCRDALLTDPTFEAYDVDPISDWGDRLN